MPDLRNCRRCGKMFNYIGVPICPTCVESDEADFKRVKEYLYQNPGASMSEVSSVLEISIEKITRYLRDGRLEIVGGSGNMILHCESCGKSINSGRFCDMCSNDLSKGFKSTADQLSKSANNSNDETKRTAEMRFLNKNEKR